MTVPAQDSHLRARVQALMPALVEALGGLVRVPSVSASADRGPLVEAAGEVRRLFEAAGAATRLLETPGAPPALLAEAPGPPGAPTALLYAHYDVQPAGDAQAWESPPFEPVVRNGRLYGRGASDDKAGVVTHLGVLQAFEGRPPLHLKVLVEGEEEIGSPHIAAFLEAHARTLAADLIVIADLEHPAVGTPALTTSLRGIVDCVVEVRVLDAGVHSGQFGGPVPDALIALSRLLASLHDDAGNPAVEGLRAGPAPAGGPSEEELRAQAGVRPGVRLLGDGSVAERLWRRPAVSVLGVDAPSVAEAINQLVPAARAKVSVRLAPGDDPDAAMAALTKHLEVHVPWGVEVSVTPGARARPFEAEARGPGADAFRAGMRAAWGVEPVEVGVGGTVPLVAEFATAFPGASLVLAGVGDPSSHIHGPDESQDLGELERNILAEALALEAFAAGWRAGGAHP